MATTPIFGFSYEAPEDLPGETLTGGPSGTHPILAEQIEDVLKLLVIRSGYTALTDDSPSSASTFEQWGTETIEFANPGMAVSVAAWGTGEADNTVEVADVSMRLQISFDGGGTWTSGERPRGNVGPDGADNRENIAAIHYRSGTPTGSVAVRAQLLSGSTDSMFDTGGIMALMHPAAS